MTTRRPLGPGPQHTSITPPTDGAYTPGVQAPEADLSHARLLPPATPDTVQHLRERGVLSAQ